MNYPRNEKRPDYFELEYREKRDEGELPNYDLPDEAGRATNIALDSCLRNIFSISAEDIL